MEEILNISAVDSIKMKENYNKQEQVIKGTAGTLHLNNIDNKDIIVDEACRIAQRTHQPVVIVVRL